ncbi:MAG: ATP-binding cassette domain-containing protein [Spirochaetes bacterium]|jgi:putative ABC transport system ATP-binding protein|nr:ATP-binding cassette domain-containing protein [Spirochaetota bacterium]
MIKFDSVSITLDGAQLFHDFNYTVPISKTLLINGKSGSGKSTLLRMILGFENRYTGQIVFNGIPVSAETVHKVRSNCSYVSQDVDLPDGTVQNVIDTIFSLKANQHMQPDKSLLHAMIEKLQLPHDLLNKETSQLSGGERQRTGIVIAFLLKRPVLLLDEPTSGVEAAMKQTLVSTITESGKTAVVVSHDPEWQNSTNIQILEL